MVFARALLWTRATIRATGFVSGWAHQASNASGSIGAEIRPRGQAPALQHIRARRDEGFGRLYGRVSAPLPA